MNETADAPIWDTDGGAGWAVRILLFLAIVLMGYGVGKGFRYAQKRWSRRRPTSSQILFGQLVQFLTVTVAFFVAISGIYKVDVLGLVAALGIVSLALGFGLQNTVANLAAGVGLSVDKPFEVGDRIRVEETWGDVVGIGLRSTRIMTTAGEHVIIPNAVLDTQAVWNFTHLGAGRLRVDIPIGISYQSSLPLAENLSKRIARSVDEVLSYPEPEVIYQGYGDNAIQFELRFWIEQARDRNNVRNRVMRGIKTAFDENGVHFPFPQRTISYLADLPAPAPTPEHLEGDSVTKSVIMVVETGYPNRAMAKASATVAKRLDARLVVLHVRPPHKSLDTDIALQAVNAYIDEARKLRIPASGRTEVGHSAHSLRVIGREVGAKLVLLEDTGRFRLGGGITRADVIRLQTDGMWIGLITPNKPIPEEKMDELALALAPKASEINDENAGD